MYRKTALPVWGCRFVCMQFSDTTTAKNGMLQECESWLFGNEYGTITDNTELLSTFTRYINYGLDESTVDILEVDGRWQYGDTNYTTHPIGTTNLVDGQQDYQLSVSHLKILAVEILDDGGNWHTVTPIDMQDLRRKGFAQVEFMEESGFPQYYDLLGDSIFLYPKPETSYVTLTGGLKVYFQREPSYFTTDDDTKEPGIPRTFHDLPILYACAKYAKANQMTEKARELDAEIEKRKTKMQWFVSKRNVDSKPRLQARYKSAA